MIKKRKNSFLKKINKFKNKKILVVGDIMLDEYLWGEVERISPEAPVPVVNVEKETKIPGGAANVVNNLLGLGAKVYLSGIIGNDDSGKDIKKYFTKRDVNLSGLISVTGRLTTLKTRIIAHSHAHDQQIVRVDKESTEPLSNDVIKKIIKYVDSIINKIDGIIISDYGKGVIIPALIDDIIKKANKSKKIIAVDPKVEHFFQYKNVSLITPNHFEAGNAINIKIKNQKDVIKAGKKIMTMLNLDSLFITQSKDGMTVFQKKNQPAHISTHAKKVYDVTGAGDTVISAAVMSLVSGCTYEEAGALSNYAAGIVVGEVGTTIITLSKLKTKLNEK